MNPITISINDTNYYSESQEHIPRLYDLSKKLCFFVRYLNTNFEVQFIDLIPTSLSTLDFDATVSETEFMKATVSFTYTYYEIRSINSGARIIG